MRRKKGFDHPTEGLIVSEKWKKFLTDTAVAFVKRKDSGFGETMRKNQKKRWRALKSVS